MEESDACMRARLVESLSQSFPGSALSRALHAMDSDDTDSRDDPLSSSCFAELRLDKGKPDLEEDEELTSLSWLQDADLLKNIRAGDGSLCTSPVDDDMQKENGDGTNTYGHQHPPHVPYNPQKHVNSKPPYSFSCLIFMAIEDSPIKKLPVKDIYNWILSHFPYFQNAPTGWKNSVRHNLSLNKCFKKVEKEKGQSIGKGSLWCIDPDFRPNLLQALRKTPYHPYHQLQMLATPQPQPNYTLMTGSQRPLPLTTRFNVNTPSPHLFPFLSRRLAQSKFDVESDIDVANTLVSLKGLSTRNRIQNGWSGDEGHDSSRSPSPPEFGSERERQLLKRKNNSHQRPTSPIVLTMCPSDDHTYSITRLPTQPGSPGSSIDEEYEFGRQGGSDSEEDKWSDTSAESDYEDCMEQYRADKWRRRREQMELNGDIATPVKQRLMAAENDDEEMKIVEGADALLNLAGIKMASIVPLRSISPQQSGSNRGTPNHLSSNTNNNDLRTSNFNQTVPKQEPEEKMSMEVS